MVGRRAERRHITGLGEETEGPTSRDTGVAGTTDVSAVAYFTGLSKDSPVQGGAGFLVVLLGRLHIPDRILLTDSPVWGAQLHQNMTFASCFPDLLYRLSYGGVSSNGCGKSGGLLR